MFKFMTSNHKRFRTSNHKRVQLSALGAPTVAVTVSENTLIRAIPADFVGFGVGITASFNYLKLLETKPSIHQLFRNLGQSRIRIGVGDYGTWDPNAATPPLNEWVSSTITKGMVEQIYNAWDSVGWDIIWLLNLRDNNPSLFANEAAYIYSICGPKLLGIEIGNEPDNYYKNGIRATTYTYADYLNEWDAYESAIHILDPSIPLTGPSTAYTEWLSNFSIDRGSKVQFLNEHKYSVTRGASGTLAPTIENLLSHHVMDVLTTQIQTWAGYANDAGLPLIIGESNSVAVQGVEGVSDTIASALWGIEYAFIALENNISHISFHGLFYDVDTFYAPVHTDGTPGPLYYAALLFHYAAPDGNSVASSVEATQYVVSHAIVRSDGTLAVVVSNHDLNTPAVVDIVTENTYTTAKVIYLSSPSIDSTAGFTLGGSAVDSEYGWVPTESINLTIIHKHVVIRVPAWKSAVVIFS